MVVSVHIYVSVEDPREGSLFDALFPELQGSLWVSWVEHGWIALVLVGFALRFGGSPSSALSHKLFWGRVPLLK